MGVEDTGTGCVRVLDSLQGAEGSGAERSHHLKLYLVIFDRVLFRLLRRELSLKIV